MFTWGWFTLDTLIILSDLSTFGIFVSISLMLVQKKSAAGISLQTLIAVVSQRFVHFQSHRLSVHYIPHVLSFSMYYALDVLNVLSGCLLICVFVLKFYATYEKEKDTFGFQFVEDFIPPKHILKKNPLVYTAIMSIIVLAGTVLWYLLRGILTTTTSFYFCFYEILSAVGLLPQLFMFHRDKRVNTLLANFMVLSAYNRMIMFTFWALIPWLTNLKLANRPVQMASEGFNLLILSDFMYYWCRSKVRGEKQIVIGDFNV